MKRHLNGMSMAIGVLLVDNQALFREGIRALLQAAPGIEIVGEAVAAQDAIDKATALKPDLVIMEIMLPDGKGIAAIRTIRQRLPRTQVLVLTSRLDQTFQEVAKAGAIGYVLKDINSADLVKAIRSAYDGKRTLSPTVVEHLIEQFFAAPRVDGDPNGDAPSDQRPLLKQYDIEVLTGVTQGLSDQQIAAHLLVSKSTVKTRLRNIYRKLGLRNRAHAAVFAAEHLLLH